MKREVGERDRKCLVGHDTEDGVAIVLILAAIAIVIAVVCFLIYVSVYIILYGGGILGGFFSIRNYLISLKHNIWDSNFRKTSLENAA